ncbi:hypothetical protein QQ056_03630 [Oscillatoria laete-virens NRMC-F 0139]|nr:hypothetical protein [Oscillatoria laete-virens]MDL5052652.1 hypothetical protein [Oscillatoria laete-virens NRMC-F 0139]
MTSNDKIQKIQQTLERLTLALQSDCGLQDFDTVEIPFQLTQACIQLWTDCFSLSMLQNLANDDSDTLEAWAIAFNTTLQVQLGILNQWMPLLSAPSLPSKLGEKAAQRTAELERIATEKSVLIQAAPNLLAQETDLRNAAAELEALRAKINELQAIEADVNATDLTTLRSQVRQKENELLPQKQAIERLHQQKTDLDTQITLLNQQREILESETDSQKLRLERQQLEVMSQIRTLLVLTEAARAQLSAPLTEALDDLDRQRNEYNQQWEQLQQAIIACDRYRAETKAICADLNAHYQIDAVLGQRLPIDRRRMETLMQTIQERLAELDRELQAAQAHHERSQQKQYFVFGT